MSIYPSQRRTSLGQMKRLNLCLSSSLLTHPQKIKNLLGTSGNRVTVNLNYITEMGMWMPITDGLCMSAIKGKPAVHRQLATVSSWQTDQLHIGKLLAVKLTIATGSLWPGADDQKTKICSFPRAALVKQ